MVLVFRVIENDGFNCGHHHDCGYSELFVDNIIVFGSVVGSDCCGCSVFFLLFVETEAVVLALVKMMVMVL